MQNWSLTVMICLLWRAKDLYDGSKTKEMYVYLVLSAVLYCVAVLSSACVILIPIICILLIRLFKGKSIRAVFTFFGTCLLIGALYLGGILIRGGIEHTLFGIKGIVSGDGSHLSGALLSGHSKPISYMLNCLTIGAWLAATLMIAFAVSLLVSRIRKNKVKNLWMYLWIFESFLITLYGWFIKKSGYESLKLYIPVIIMSVLVHLIQNSKNLDSKKQIAFFAMLIHFFAFVNVLLISNISIIANLTFLNGAVLWGLVALSMGKKEDEKKVLNEGLVFVSYFLVIASGTAFTLNGGPIGTTIFNIPEKTQMTSGPAKHVIVSKDVEEMYDRNTEHFLKMVKEGSNVLLVTNYFYNTSLSALYMVGESGVSHYTVNSTPTYNNTLYEFWAMYPEKRPDVVVINRDSCFDYDVMWALALIGNPDNWIYDKEGNVDYFVRPECVKEHYTSN